MKNKVYVIQDVPGSREGRPKINIIGASELRYYPIEIDLYQKESS